MGAKIDNLAARAWLSSIGPGEHDFPALRALWASLGNASVTDAALGRWLTAAGFVRSRRGAAKTQFYRRPARRDARRTREAVEVTARVDTVAVPPLDAMIVVVARPILSGARLLARRYAQLLPAGEHRLVDLAAEFGEWCVLAGEDTVDGAVLAEWLAQDGHSCGVAADSARRAA